MDGLIMAAQLILGLSILVTLHELGHFLPAKLFGMRVEKFFLFFDIANIKLFSFKKEGTEYGVGWLPAGGYVKIAGMIDESLDMEAMKAEPEAWEFRAKPAWQRLIVMVGGVTVNLITGVIIFIALTYFLGERYLSTKEAKFGIVAYSLAEEMGLRTGDKILKINGTVIDRFPYMPTAEVFLESKSFYTVDRGGDIVDVQVPSNFVDKFSDKKRPEQFIEPIMPFKVGKVVDGSAASQAGLMEGDKIVAIDGLPINYFHELQKTLKVKAEKSISISVDRNGQPKVLNALVTKEGKLGFQVQSLLKEEIEKYGLIESIEKGTIKAFTIVVVQVKAFRKMFSGEMDVTKSLSGPIGIAKEFGGTWDWVRFWSLTGLLSMVLAFMNLLPIPALDGGHVIFLLYEIIAGRKPSDKFLEYSQRVGMALLLGLMVFAVFNDIIKLIF